MDEYLAVIALCEDNWGFVCPWAEIWRRLLILMTSCDFAVQGRVTKSKGNFVFADSHSTSDQRKPISV
jgi:hypothetical protein